MSCCYVQLDPSANKILFYVFATTLQVIFRETANNEDCLITFHAQCTKKCCHNQLIFHYVKCFAFAEELEAFMYP